MLIASGTVVNQMAPVNARTYAGQTGEERAAERRGALLDAAFVLVAEGGWGALRVDPVCRAAGLNKRYFAESFASADALAAALTDRLAQEALAAALAAIDLERPDEEQTRRAVAAFVVALTEDPRRARVLFGAVPDGDRAAAHRAAALREVIVTVASVGRRLRSMGEDPLVELTAALLVGGTSQAVLDWIDGRIPSTRDELVDDLVALWHVVADGAAARAGERPVSPAERGSGRATRARPAP